MTETAEPSSSAVFRAAQWLRARWSGFFVTSAALLIPCFWHRHIQACDLGSHLYTAWLTQSVSRGLLPGLHLGRQYTNVLVDLLLSKLFPYFGAIGTERLVVGLCVLIFFWGAFAFASAAARRAAWNAAPLLAMVAYGAIFHWGFFNFYLSAGLSFFALAIVVSGTGKDLILLPVLLALSAVAHPLGAACLLALGAYLAALRWIPAKHHLPMTMLLVGFAFGVWAYLVRHFLVLQREIHMYWLLGADQLVVFGRGYLWLGVAALATCAVCVFMALRKTPIADILPWLQFYLAIALVVAFAPGGLASESTFGMMGYLPDRGSLYSAVALATLVACCRPRLWFTASCAILAVIFFTAIYHDTGILDRRNTKVAELVSACPGRRVIAMIRPIPGSRIHEDHALDRACIGQCYAYTNYEPSSGQFRLRADPGNRFIEMDQDALDAIQDGSYIVQPRDLPVYEVYQCGAGVNDLCLAELHDGQQIGDVPGITTTP
jgi:hypothetical protein